MKTTRPFDRRTFLKLSTGALAAAAALPVKRGQVYLWRVLRPTVLAETELVWQVGYTLLDRLISTLAQWEGNADGRRGWWQGRLQQVVGLAERFLKVTSELEPVFLAEQGERLSFHPYLEHIR